MSIEETESLDAIGIEEGSGYVTLTIADHLTWDDVGVHIGLLADKLESYLQFVEGGQLLLTEPRAAGRQVVVQVYARYPLPGAATSFFREVETTLMRNGIRFRWLLFGGPDPGIDPT